MPGRDSGGYDAPSPAERDAFLAVLDLALVGEVRRADSVAQAFRYDAEHTIDDGSGDTLIAIVERAPIIRGWGTILIRPGGRPVAIHVNHPLFDINTPRVAGELFEACACRALIMAGTHRYANGGDASDMARSTTSIFEGVHERLAGTGVAAVSVHGYANDSYDGPIATADVVLSNGATPSGDLRAAPSAIVLRDMLRGSGFAAGHVAADTGWVFLTATSNPQGRHSNARFGVGRWIHIEIDREIRESETRYLPLVGVVAAWLEVEGTEPRSRIETAGPPGA
jgi:hypothetical protein